MPPIYPHRVRLTLRALRVAALVLLPLLGMALLAVWLVPPMLDWNRYRSSIAALVSEQLGRAVRIEGPVSLSLLPQPFLTAGHITVEDAQDGVTIEVAELRLRLALGPLLAQRVDAQELVLRGLDVSIPWPLDTAGLHIRAPVWLSSLSARIEDGRVAVGGVAVTGINATLGTLPETGSYAAAGIATLAGQSWHMTARLSRAGGDGAAGLDLTLDGQGPMQGLGAAFSGQIAADGQLGGHVSGRGPDLSRLLPAPPVPFRADGRLSLSAGLALADNLDMDIAGSPARGAVSLRLGGLPRLDMALTASRLSLDAWLSALLRGSNRGFAPVATGIDLSAEAATLAGGTLRGLRGRFEIDSTGVALRDGQMVLPGEAKLALDGRFAGEAGDRPPKFDGRFHLEAPALRTTMAWAEATGLGVMGMVPSGVLRTAALRGDVTADTGTGMRLGFTNLAGQIDGTDLKGSLTLSPGARPGVQARLSLGQVELDPWLPSELPALGQIAGRSRADLSVELQAGEVLLLGERLTQVALDAGTEAGVLRLRRLEASTSSLRISARGVVQDGGRLTEGRLELQSPSIDQVATSLAPVVARLLPDLPAGLAAIRVPRWPGNLVVQGAGPIEALALRAVLDLGDLHAETQPVLDLTNLRFTAPIMLRHPGAPRLLDGLGVAGTASWLGDGSLSMVASLSGTPARLSAESFDLAAGSLRANGTLSLDRGKLPRLTGRVTAETLPLPLPYPRGREPLALGVLAGWQAAVKLEAGRVVAGMSPVLDQVTTLVSLNDGVLRLDAVTGKLDGGALTGAVALDSQSDPPKLSADLALTGATITGPLFELPIDLAGGVLDVATSFTATGHAPAALLSTLSGTVRLSARDAVLNGVDLAAAGPRLLEPDVRKSLLGGSTAVEQISMAASLRNGAATIDNASFASSAGSGTISGLIDIAGETLELRVAMRPNVDQPPEIAVRLSGTWANPLRTPETFETQSWRATH